MRHRHHLPHEFGRLARKRISHWQVQILADGAIHDKVGEPTWARAVKAISDAMRGGRDPTAGIIEAVEICGAALREHFPATGPREHAFSPRPLEV